MIKITEIIIAVAWATLLVLPITILLIVLSSIIKYIIISVILIVIVSLKVYKFILNIIKI